LTSRGGIRSFRDRDFVIDDKGVIFCVIGNMHPKDSVIAYPRYFPVREGQQSHAVLRYSRAMPSYGVKSLIQSLARLDSNYGYSAHRLKHAQIPVVPLDTITRHLKPEARLWEISSSSVRDDLEELTIRLVEGLSRICGVPVGSFGVTGSILASLHDSRLSDIDLTVYGRPAANMVRSILDSEGDPGEGIARLKDEEFTAWSRRVAKTYGLSLAQAERICSRKWNYRNFKGRRFSIHPVLTEAEKEGEFDDFRYESLGLFAVKATICGDADSLFMPHRYQLQDTTIRGNGSDIFVKELVSYEGIYGNVFRQGDNIEAWGKIEKVTYKNREDHYRLLIGSLEAGGRDYVRFS